VLRSLRFKGNPSLEGQQPKPSLAATHPEQPLPNTLRMCPGLILSIGACNVQVRLFPGFAQPPANPPHRGFLGLKRSGVNAAPSQHFKPTIESMTPPRRSSLGMLLRRSKSGDLKKQQAAKEQELKRQRDASVSKSPPRLPVLYNGAPSPQLGMGGTDGRADSLSIVSGRADYSSNATPRPSMEPSRSIISVPPPLPNGGFDPYANTGSMAHRGRYSYASSAVSTINSPRRVRRRKDPTPFKYVRPRFGLVDSCGTLLLIIP